MNRFRLFGVYVVIMTSLGLALVTYCNGQSATFCPVISPDDEAVYISDPPTRTLKGSSKSQCATQCLAFAIEYAKSNNTANDSCICFNYNSTSSVCSLFSYNPNNTATDPKASTVAYQFLRQPLTGLWPTVSSTDCSFPFNLHNNTYQTCRFSATMDPVCNTSYYSCKLPGGSTAFCIPANATDTTVATTTSSIVPYVDHPENGCSFPFTYNGVIYYRCIQGFMEISSYCQPYGCLAVNRSVIGCYLPADYVAVEYAVYVNFTIHPEIPMILSPSVFQWIIIMRKSQNAFNWTLPWTDYRDGFSENGTISDFWLGLQRVHLLTSGASYRLRVEVQDSASSLWYSGEYWTFTVGSENETQFALSVDGFFGGDLVTDGFNPMQSANETVQNGMKFSTYDVDNDNSSRDCSNLVGGVGWWYNDCYWNLLTSNNISENVWPFGDTTVAELHQISASRLMIKIRPDD